METPQRPTTVLIVEDEVIIRMSVAATLEDAGFGILEAGNSAEALQLLLKHQEVNVLMTDVRLPGEMDGLDLVDCVQRFHPAIRALVVSGNSSAREASDAGAFAFLSKPYMAHSLVRAVRQLLQSKAVPLRQTI